MSRSNLKLCSVSEVPETEHTMKDSITSVLKALGENPQREGLRDTPKRWAKAMGFLTSGYTGDIHKLVGNALFQQEASEIVLVRNIEMFSLCEHHLLPFFGRVHIAYIPNGKIIGLSKLPRIVDLYSRRLQVQERLTSQISQALEDVLKPQGVAVIVEAVHMCMMMRGVEKQQSSTITSSIKGMFQHNPATRDELFTLLNRP